MLGSPTAGAGPVSQLLRTTAWKSDAAFIHVMAADLLPIITRSMFKAPKRECRGALCGIGVVVVDGVGGVGGVLGCVCVCVCVWGEGLWELREL